MQHHTNAKRRIPQVSVKTQKPEALTLECRFCGLPFCGLYGSVEGPLLDHIQIKHPYETLTFRQEVSLLAKQAEDIDRDLKRKKRSPFAAIVAAVVFFLFTPFVQAQSLLSFPEVESLSVAYIARRMQRDQRPLVRKIWWVLPAVSIAVHLEAGIRNERILHDPSCWTTRVYR